MLASDSGHQANARGSLDGTFGVNDASLRNSGGDALKKTRDTAVYLIRARYAATPSRAYFAGGSTGGREALQSIQRWPADSGAPLRCAGGADTGDNCLSDAQITALKAINAPVTFGFPLASGETGCPGYNVWGADLGITSLVTAVQPTVTFLNFGITAPANPMPTTAPYISQQLEQVLKNVITRDGSFNPLTFDPLAATPWASRRGDLSRMIDQSPDLSGFVNRGGKLLLAHGVHDVLVSSRATADYCTRLVARFGQPAVDGFARYYEVPGLGDAVSSQFNATWDSLTALEEWAEQGRAPTAQVTRAIVGVPGRTRPLCDYPKWPRYGGTGDVNAAASSTCVT